MATKKLILKVVADVKDAKSGLAEVATGIRDMFKGAEGAGQGVINGTLKAFDGLSSVLSRVAPAAQTVLAIAETAIEFAQFAGERERLERNVSGTQVAALRMATQGMVDDMTLMKAAAQGMRGDFALTQTQMENVARAAVTLHNQGFGPIPEIVADITEKLRTGEVDGLKKYGFSAGETGTKVEKLGRAHQAMGVLATDANNGMSDSSTELTKLMVTLKNAFDDVKSAIGSVIGEAARYINQAIEGGAVLIDLSAKLVDVTGAYRESQKIVLEMPSAMALYNQAVEDHERQTKAAANAVNLLTVEWLGMRSVIRETRGLLTTDVGDAWVNDMAEMLGGVNELVKAGPAWYAARQRAAIEAARAEEKAWRDTLDAIAARNDFLLERMEARQAAEAAAIASAVALYQPYLDVIHEVGEGMDRMRESLAAIANDNAGPLGSLSKRMDDMAKSTKKAIDAGQAFEDIYLDAWKGVSAAAGQAMFAMISGQQGAQVSLSQLFDQFLEQFGMRMQLNALEAAGLALLHTFTAPPQAAAEWAAAGAFQAAAIAAGLGARAINSGGGSAGSGGGGGGSTPANSNTAGRDSLSSSGGGQSSVHYHFKIGYGFVGDEKRLARELHSVMRKGELTGAVRPATGTRRAG